MESPRWRPAAPLVLSCPASRQPSGRATRCGVVQSLMQRIDVISGYETLFSWLVNTKIGSKLLSLWVILTHTHLSMDSNWLEKREWLINVDTHHGEHLFRIFWASKFRPCSTNLLRRGYASDWQVREVQVVVKWGGELTVPWQISAAVVTCQPGNGGSFRF